MFRIMGSLNGTVECLDTAETAEEADYLVGEYRLAFGERWKIHRYPQRANQSRHQSTKEKVLRVTPT